jgi:hypothetical protein
MTTQNNNSLVNLSNPFECKMCNYITCRKYNLDIHYNSVKHKNNANPTKNNGQLVKISKTYNCSNCEKMFKDRAGLWRHSQKCNIEKDLFDTDKNAVKKCDKDLILMLINDNKDLRNLLIEQSKEKDEFKTMMMEVIKNGTNNTTNNTNSHNKSFNLNFFLNETCKDAMNITEFVNSIQLQLSDLERMGEVGYVEGLTSIISRNLKALDVNMRPVHCTDKKREIMYIKDETKWEKDEENTKMHKMIKNVAFENQRQILKYKEIHPDCGKSSSKYSDPYNKILVECMGGAGDNDFEKEEKIISKISKVVLVDKDNSL